MVPPILELERGRASRVHIRPRGRGYRTAEGRLGWQWRGHARALRSIVRVFFLRNASYAGAADLAFQFGAGGGGLVPLAGDWDGDGVDTIGLYVLRRAPSSSGTRTRGGVADIVFTFGAGGQGYVPIAGDWKRRRRRHHPGLYNPATGVFFLRDSNSNGPADLAFSYGAPGAVPLAGDWDDDGADTIGIYVPATGVSFLKNSNASGAADLAFNYGTLNVLPLTGRWNSNGGILANGALHTGTTGLTQEIDVWSFTATVGDRIGVHIGEMVDNDDFQPRLRLQAPDGNIIASDFGTDAAAINGIAAPASGAYQVLVSSFDSLFDGTGTYRLTMTKTPGPITVSAGDQGGPLTNGALHVGEILQGDLDVWTINAVAGQQITALISEASETDDFRPWIRVWAPDGTIVGSASGPTTAQIGPIAAPVSGTYLVLVGSLDFGVDGIGTYSLTVSVGP